MTTFITTSEIAKEAGIGQRTIQKRIKRLGIQPIRLGAGFLLTISQAERVRRDRRKPGPKRAKKSSNNGK